MHTSWVNKMMTKNPYQKGWDRGESKDTVLERDYFLQNYQKKIPAL